MYSKTQWITKLGPVTLSIALFSTALAGQTRNVPSTRFGFMELDEARDLMNSGKDLFEKGKYTEAAERFRQVVQRFSKNPVAEQSNYFLIRSLAKLNKTSEAMVLIDSFLKERPRSRWANDVREIRMDLTKQAPPDLLIATTRPQVPAPPTMPVPARVASTPSAVEPAVVGVVTGQTPAPAPPALLGGRGGPGRVPRPDE